MNKLNPDDPGHVLSVLLMYGCEQVTYTQISDIMSSEHDFQPSSFILKQLLRI